MSDNKHGAFSRPSEWNRIHRAFLNPRRLINRVFQHLSRYAFWIPPRWRVSLQAWRGVDFQDVGRVFIGDNVLFDGIYPELIHIGANVMITDGAKILSHFYDPSYTEHCMRIGHIYLEDDVFIGMNAIIAAPVRIGRGAVVGAGAVVTHDVPANTIVGGIPARPLGQRGDEELPDDLRGAWQS